MSSNGGSNVYAQMERDLDKNIRSAKRMSKRVDKNIRKLQERKFIKACEDISSEIPSIIPRK